MSGKSQNTNNQDPPHAGKPVTLCLLVDDNNVLLALKKKGFGTGKWNGVGGKVEDGEMIEEAAIRETQEEIGVTPKDIMRAAIIHYMPYDITMHVYIAKDWDGEPVETEEMAPKWFPKNALPQDMWDSDKHWLPRVLDGVKLRANFVYDENNNILSQEITEGLK